LREARASRASRNRFVRMYDALEFEPETLALEVRREEK